MKFYINYDSEGRGLPVKGKAYYLVHKDTAIPVHELFEFNKIPEGKALVIVVDHGSFDSAMLLTKTTYEELVTNASSPYQLLLWDLDTALQRSGMAEYLNI